MTISLIILLLTIHFLADFALQTHDQAMLKSTNDTQLGYHCLTYSLVWGIAFTYFFPTFALVIPATIGIFTFHFITDYITSRIVKKYFDKQDYHNAFVVIGADQMLHYIQILLIFKLFTT